MADLIDNIAGFIACYRAAGGDAPRMLQAVLTEFAGASPDDYARALIRANRARHREAVR